MKDNTMKKMLELYAKCPKPEKTISLIITLSKSPYRKYVELKDMKDNNA